MKPIVFALPGNEAFLTALGASIAFEPGVLETRRFPDGEAYVRIDTPVEGRPVAVLCTLAHPDPVFLTLWYAARTLRELGAGRVGLIAPYLAYMRQDRSFQPGEAVSSRHFAALLSSAFDWLVTADPHLHRYRALAELYPIAAFAVECAPALSAWLRANVHHPIVIGPDAESEQWVVAVARKAGAPYLLLEKSRRGDRDVVIRLPDLDRARGHTPVLVDDIVSSGRTMAEAVRELVAAGMASPVCIGVHALLDDEAHAALLHAGAARVVTTNTITHRTNAIDVSPRFAASLAACFAATLAGAERRSRGTP